MIRTVRQEKRRQERFTRRCEIEFSSGSQTYFGISSNFSISGLFIRTRNPFVPGTFIAIVLHLPNGSLSKLTGRVIRAHKTTLGATVSASGFFKEKDGMGVELTEKDSYYLQFIASSLVCLGP